MTIKILVTVYMIIKMNKFTYSYNYLYILTEAHLIET